MILKSIDDYIKRKVLTKEKTSSAEISSLLNIVNRDINDSKNADISLDW